MISRRNLFTLGSAAFVAGCRRKQQPEEQAAPTYEIPSRADDLLSRGKIHIPIGIPNSPDSLKTFVEAEGCFSPGFGTFGVYFWLYDLEEKKLFAPTLAGVSARHGLHEGRYLLPWTEWSAGPLQVRTEVCQTAAEESAQVAAARVRLTSSDTSPRQVRIYAAVRPCGPAGGAVNSMKTGRNALLINDATAIVAERRPSASGVMSTDEIGKLAMDGRVPETATASSATGDCSGVLCFDLRLGAGRFETLNFVCPVLPGRPAVRHRWEERRGQNAMVDAEPLFSANGGPVQKDLGLKAYSSLKADNLFRKSAEEWKQIAGPLQLSMPDARWNSAMTAILSHAAMCLNEGAPDVAVVNYNVYNRDGVYVANMLQKAGRFPLAEFAIDYFLAHPFNGRAYPEADNPGQILWIMGEHWRMSRDRAWLDRVYAQGTQVASMIEYYRTKPGPHWVEMQQLRFGAQASPDKRQELQPGRCDGLHPEYTEAFDIAGLRAASMLAQAMDKPADAGRWTQLAQSFMSDYDRRFGSKLRNEYGSYCVLWPCRLYETHTGRAAAQFRGIGAQNLQSWRYFPLATAHQGLLAGSREAGYKTLDMHLGHEQMQGWYALDEGGGSSSGGWWRSRTTWPHSKERPGENRAVAMPHGWSIAEFWLLMRDSVAFEDEDRIVLLAGVPPEWFRHPSGMAAAKLATWFGDLSLAWTTSGSTAELHLDGSADPPGGFVLRLPPGLAAEASAGAQPLKPGADGDLRIPRGVQNVSLRLNG